MSDAEETDYKTKRLETLARAREIARQNRLSKTAVKKDIHDKQIKERKEARLKAQKEIKEKQDSNSTEQQASDNDQEDTDVSEAVVSEIELPPKKKGSQETQKEANYCGRV